MSFELEACFFFHFVNVIQDADCEFCLSVICENKRRELLMKYDF